MSNDHLLKNAKILKVMLFETALTGCAKMNGSYIFDSDKPFKEKLTLKFLGVNSVNEHKFETV